MEDAPLQFLSVVSISVFIFRNETSDQRFHSGWFPDVVCFDTEIVWAFSSFHNCQAGRTEKVVAK